MDVQTPYTLQESTKDSIRYETLQYIYQCHDHSPMAFYVENNIGLKASVAQIQ